MDAEYRHLISRGGSEFKILLDLSRVEQADFTTPRIVEGIMRVREGRLTIVPGYDGVYGQVKIFEEEEMKPEQISLF